VGYTKGEQNAKVASCTCK